MLPLRLDFPEGHRVSNNYFTEMCSASEVGSYLRLIDCVCRSTLSLRVRTKKSIASQTWTVPPATPGSPLVPFIMKGSKFRVQVLGIEVHTPI